MSQRKPSIYIPTLYFAEGLPYVIVNTMSGIFLKSLGANNIVIGWLSLLSWPWILKFAWSPLVDFYATKRKWIVIVEFVLAVLVFGIAVIAYSSGSLSFWFMVAGAGGVLTLTALASATHDTSIDGYYLDVLNKEQQAWYVGVRNTAYRVSMIFGSGVMVYLAGKLAETHGLHFGWAAAFAMCALAMLACALFHLKYLPEPGRTTADNAGETSGSGDAGRVDVPQIAATEAPPADAAPAVEHNFGKALLTYFQQPGIGAIVFYILVFRLGDALMLKQAPNFLLDPRSRNGLGISVADIGMITGTFGVIALLVGGILASWLISKHGLKRWMWPLALIQNSAILLYWVLAHSPRTFAFQLPVFDNPYVPAVYVINSVEQFAYGMGVAAYTVFLLSTVRSEYKAAHYAMATALMALGVMIPGIASGYIYKDLGYANFFLVSFLASLPGIFAIFFLPLWRNDVGVSAEDDGGRARGISKAGQMGSEG